MTSRSRSLVRAAFITLLIALLPLAGRAQQQEPPAAPTPENASPETSAQKPAEATPGNQQGNVLVPTETNQAPERTPETAAQEAPKEENGTTYTIKRGDTLWDISNTFLKDPFLWPFIWKANQYIANPDLIYPGNNLAIPNLAPIERAMRAQPAPKEQLAEKQTTTAETQPTPAKSEEEKQAAGRKLILPEEKPIPVIDSHSMLGAGFVMTNEFRSGRKDRIVGSKDDKTVLAYDDIVYVDIPSKPEAAAGDKFIIYEILNPVTHPVTGKVIGDLVKVLGVLQLTEKGSAPGIFAARITLSFDFSGIGSLLTPYQEPTLVYRTGREQDMGKDIAGYILAVLNEHTLGSQTDFVYLDKGSADGVEPGDRFVIFGPRQNKSYPRNIIGEARVFLVKERTSTAVISESSNAINRGDKVEYLK